MSDIHDDDDGHDNIDAVEMDLSTPDGNEPEPVEVRKESPSQNTRADSNEFHNNLSSNPDTKDVSDSGREANGRHKDYHDQSVPSKYNDGAEYDRSPMSPHSRHRRGRRHRDYRSPDIYDDDSRHRQSYNTKLIQIVNISPLATLEQLKKLMNFLGNIIDIQLYHDFSDNPGKHNPDTTDISFKVCFVEFEEHSSVLMAQHLTNTVFIDRAIIVLPYDKTKVIPNKDQVFAEKDDDAIAVQALVTNYNHGVFSQVVTNTTGTQVIQTVDPRLTALSLPQYPNLPINTEPSRVEEIRRTVYVGNLDSTVPPDQVMQFFSKIGEVKYIRIAGDETQATRFAFVEYTHQSSIMSAVQYNGSMLGGRSLKISHSNNSIVKPPSKNTELISSSYDDDYGSRKARERSMSLEYSSRDRHRSSRHERSRRNRHRRDRDDRHRSPRRGSRRRSESRDREYRRHSRSPHDGSSSRRSRSRDHADVSSHGRRNQSRDSKRKRSRSRTPDRSRASKHHRSSKR